MGDDGFTMALLNEDCDRFLSHKFDDTSTLTSNHLENISTPNSSTMKKISDSTIALLNRSTNTIRLNETGDSTMRETSGYTFGSKYHSIAKTPTMVPSGNASINRSKYRYRVSMKSFYTIEIIDPATSSSFKVRHKVDKSLGEHKNWPVDIIPGLSENPLKDFTIKQLSSNYTPVGSEPTTPVHAKTRTVFGSNTTMNLMNTSMNYSKYLTAPENTKENDTSYNTNNDSMISTSSTIIDKTVTNATNTEKTLSDYSPATTIGSITLSDMSKTLKNKQRKVQETVKTDPIPSFMLEPLLEVQGLYHQSLVYAKFSDNWWYPGHIESKAPSYQDEKIKIHFTDDGTNAFVKRVDILRCNFLPIGTSLFFKMSDDGEYSAGIVTGYTTFNENVVYTVTCKETKKDYSVQREFTTLQGTITGLKDRFSIQAAPLTPTKSGLLLDNVMISRTRNRRSTDSSPGKEDQSLNKHAKRRRSEGGEDKRRKRRSVYADNTLPTVLENE